MRNVEYKNKYFFKNTDKIMFCKNYKTDLINRFNNLYLIEKIKNIHKLKLDRMFETIDFLMSFRKFEDLFHENEICLWNEKETYLELLLSKTDYQIFKNYLDFVQTLNSIIEDCIYNLTIDEKRKIWKLTNDFKNLIKNRKYLTEFYNKYLKNR